MDGKWEKVTSKDPKKTQKQQKKQKERAELEELQSGPTPILNARGAINPSNPFDELIAQQKRRAEEQQKKAQQNREAQKQQEQQKQKSRDVKVAPQQTPKQISVSSVKVPSETAESWIADARAKYPENIDNVQLKVVLGHLEEPFENVRSTDRGMGHLENPLASIDYPLSVLNAELRKPIEAFLETKKPEDIAEFFWYLVEQINSFDSGPFSQLVSGVGMKAMMQMLLRRPALATVVLQNFAPKTMAAYLVGGKLQDAYVNLFVWIFAQLVTVDSLAVLGLWFDYLLPSILPDDPNNPTAKVAIDFLDYLLQRVDAQRLLDGRIVQRGMAKLLVVMSAPNVNPKLQKLWPTLQRLTFFASATAPSAFFVAILTNATHKNLIFREEMLKLLCEFLRADYNCLQMWQEYYPKLFPQSFELVKYLSVHPEPFAALAQSNRSALKSALASFQQSNQQLLTKQGAANKVDVNTAIQLLKKMQSQLASSWPTIIGTSLIVVAGATYWVYTQCHPAVHPEWCNQIPPVLQQYLKL